MNNKTVLVAGLPSFTYYLNQHGFSAKLCTIENLSDSIATHKPDLVIGLYPKVLKSQCAKDCLLIAIGEPSHEFACHALSEGAIDYVRNPFDFEELRLKVTVLLDRCLIRKPSIEVGDITINLSSRTVRYQGKEVFPTKTQYELLERLVLSQGYTASHEELSIALWGHDKIHQMSNVIPHHVSRLNVMIGHSIRTMRGYGYQLVTNDAVS